MGGFIGSMWGMNLKSGLENNNYIFWVITVLSILLMIVVTFAAIVYMRYYEIIPARGMRFSRNELRKL